MTELKTRKPTGKPSWPILLLAGGEKCGKSYAAAALSASDLIDRTFWIEVGEGSADQYGALPGARYEIVEHDGSYRDMLSVAEAIVEVPRRGRPHAIVVDSMTEMWDLLCREQEAIAKRRNKSVITMDQWNDAKRKWRAFVDVLRKSFGPVIVTARYEQVTVMDAQGKPTPEKEWKIRAEKNLAYEVDGVIEIPKPRQYYLNGVRSLRFNVPPGGHMPLPDFTLDRLLRELGVADDAAQRAYVAPREEVPERAEGVTVDDILRAAPVVGESDPDGWPEVAEVPR